MEINISRVKRDIEKIAEFNATPGQGCTRFSYSPEDSKARNYLIEEINRLGLTTSIDGVGNIRARLEGSMKDAPAVLIGSHIDTVLHGGIFDGVLGVVGSLEVIRVFKENNIKNDIPIELIIFVEEEGSNFGSTMAGSKVLTGKYGIDEIKSIKNSMGLSMYEVAKEVGFDPDSSQKYLIKTGDIMAMIELHIEQSVVLESEKKPIGIVEAIAGIKWFEIEIRGVPNHAGATPMVMRNDALVGASEVITTINSKTRTAYPSTVATVGKIICHPNVPNVIPGKINFTLDVRDTNPEGIRIILNEVEKKLNEISKKFNLSTSMKLLGESNPIILSNELVNLIEETAIEKGLPYKKMNSGAGHDACLFGGITNVGMIFVPSIGGRSHVPEELTSYEDIKAGCELLLNVVYKLTSSLTKKT
ncbi:MAG: N-carbamoyl-L-amino acid hydrolase [Peptococcaceae bacterium BICA1-8]|nr:MAG: N-carbamoyl-L-amino acid hydrolase [Peptococcaceae bacterium BICA1-8]